MKFAILDTETTGLPYHRLAPLKQQPRIIEFAAILTDGITIFDQIEFKCNPGMEIEAIITKITGLTNADLREMPDFSRYIPDLKEFLSQADAAVAHNMSFDKSMVAYDLARRGLELDDVDWPPLSLCTVEETMPLHGKRMKLEQLYELHFGAKTQKHRALDDVIDLHKVCQKIGLYEAFREGQK